MERLKTRSQFQAVLAGRIVARTPHFALHVLEAEPVRTAGKGQQDASMTRLPQRSDLAGVWIGALVPKRWAKRAATRNAIRRQIYQAGSEVGSTLRPLALVVRLRATFDRTRFRSASSAELKAAVRLELHQLLNRLLPAGKEQTA